VILYFYFSPACRRTNDLRNIIKDIYFIIVERLKCGTAEEMRPERSELAALFAVATTDLFDTLL
jgi:hypothetical protein